MQHLLDIQKATGCTLEEAKVLMTLMSVRFSECSMRELVKDARETWADSADYIRREVAKDAAKAAQNG